MTNKTVNRRKAASLSRRAIHMISNNLTPPETVVEAAVYCVHFLRERDFPTPSVELATVMGGQF